MTEVKVSQGMARKGGCPETATRHRLVEYQREAGTKAAPVGPNFYQPRGGVSLKR